MQLTSPFPPAPLPDQPAIDALLVATNALITTNPTRALEMASEARTRAETAGYSAGLAWAALRCGQSLHRLGELHTAQTDLTWAATAFGNLGGHAGEAESLVSLAVVTRELGEMTGAQALLDRALQLSEQLGDLELQAKVLNQQAGLSLMTGHPARALEQLTTALSVRRQLGDRLGAAQCLNNIGQVHLRGGDLGRALSTLMESYALLRTVSDPVTTAHCLGNIAHVHQELGDHQQSYQYNVLARDLAQGQRNHTLELHYLNNMAEAISDLHRYDEASTLFTEALGMAEQIGMRSLVGCIHHGLGRAALGQGRAEAALAHHTQALETARELGETEQEVDALLGLGEAYVALRRYAPAERHLQEALPLAVSLELPKRAARIQFLLADVAEATGQLQSALDAIRAAREVEHTVFVQERERRVQQLTVQFDVERAHHEVAVSQMQTELARQAFQVAEAKVAEQTTLLVQSQVEVVTRLANAAEYRDDLTGQHTLRVGNVAALLAAQMGMPSEQISVLRVAARLHDVGKIGISDTILQKPSKLTIEEYELMKSHTLIGSQILDGGESPLLNMAKEIALSHHEHWDGHGYPHGLREGHIPLTARLVAVADVYDALSHARPYKRAWTQEEVLAELQRQSGRQFQPEIVNALLALHASGALPLGEVDPVERDDEHLQRVLIRQSEGGSTSAPVLTSSERESRLSQQLQELEHRYQQQIQELDGKFRDACVRIETLQIEAFTDALTGLANRRAFEDELETEILHAVRHRYPLSVVSIDLDGLKQVNDREGHERGDQLLRELSLALRAQIGHAARLYRIGGDEFAIIAKDVSITGQAAFMQSLERAVAQVQAVGFDAASISAGIASFPSEAKLESDLLRLSDSRMYQIKLSHREHIIPIQAI